MIAILQHSEGSVFDALSEHQTSAEFWTPRVVALIATAAGPLPLLLDMRLGVAMSHAALILWPLSILLTAVSIFLARRTGDRFFVRTVLVSMLAGYMATATYDSSRVAGMSAGFTKMDEALDFGMRLTGQIAPGAMDDDMHGSGAMDDGMKPSGQIAPGASRAAHADQPTAQGDPHVKAAIPSAPPPDQAQNDTHGGQHGFARDDDHSAPPDRHAPGKPGTVALGYAWHYWAGVMFSLSYLVLFGARRWWIAIPYLVVIIYPGMVIAMGSHSWANFVWEAVGHAGFGLTLGLVSYAFLAQRETRVAT